MLVLSASLATSTRPSNCLDSCIPYNWLRALLSAVLKSLGLLKLYDLIGSKSSSAPPCMLHGSLFNLSHELMEIHQHGCLCN